MQGMTVETGIIVEGFTCNHLFDRHKWFFDEAEVEFGGVSNVSDIREGHVGKCVTGENGSCPVVHKCGKVKVVAFSTPLRILEMDPIEVKSDELTGKHKKVCERPNLWWKTLDYVDEDGILG